MPSLPDPATPSLLELAIARLRQLFPKDYQRMIKAVAQLPPPSANVAEAKRAAPPPQPAANGRCSVKGCVFPAVVGPLCRSHLADSLAEKSLLPSTTQIAISNLECLIA